MDKSVGKPLNRVDGRLKVTGAAKYAAEYPLEGLVHAVIVPSTIATGTITRVDASAAEKAPGVLAVLTPEKTLKLAVDSEKKQTLFDPPLFVLQSRRVAYANQPVALVVADTFERATHAAALVKVQYQAEKPKADLKAERAKAYKPQTIMFRQTDLEQGQLSKEAPAAEVDATYLTPYEHHNPMEPHATTAVWEGDRLTVYDSNQGVFMARNRLAGLFGLPPENVRVIAKFVGGAFGGKSFIWSHAVLAAMAARVVAKPVKVVLQRAQMFGPVGFRPETEQRVKLQARKDGKLLLIRHDTLNPTSTFDEFTEHCGFQTRMLYASERIETSHRLVRLTVGTPTFMRAPGESTGMFALESALDELAYKLKMDPVALRLANHADSDPETGLPWSSKSLKECYRVGAEKFGWAKYNPTPGSMKDGRTLIGWGMATATFPCARLSMKAKAKATLLPDGTVRVVSGTQDLGTGTYTVMTQVAADALGVPVEKVQFDLGDTLLPEAPISGGSWTTSIVGSAVKLTALALREKVIALAVGDPGSPLHGVAPKQVQVEGGVLASGSKRESFVDLMKRQKLPSVEAQGEAQPGNPKYSSHAFGAHFVEVRVDPDLGEIRVSRWTGAFGVGTVMNAKTARSQLMGGIIMGMGMALMEKSVLDPRTGRFVTKDLADYHVPVNPDVPDIDVLFVPENDPYVNEVGAKGIGEIGITGAPAAIANAVFHATGKRLRELPLTLDKLLTA